MLQAADIGLLVFVALILSAFYVYNRSILKKDFAVVQKYKLYKVRDDLTYLVATEKLSEESFLFQLFYGTTNHLIRKTKETLCLRTFLAAMRSAEKEGLDPAEAESLGKVMGALKSGHDREVAATVSNFYKTINDILLENSFVVRLFFRWKMIRDVYRTLSRWPRVRRLLQANASRLYRRYYEAGQSLSHAT